MLNEASESEVYFLPPAIQKERYERVASRAVQEVRGLILGVYDEDGNVLVAPYEFSNFGNEYEVMMFRDLLLSTIRIAVSNQLEDEISGLYNPLKIDDLYSEPLGEDILKFVDRYIFALQNGAKSKDAYADFIMELQPLMSHQRLEHFLHSVSTQPAVEREHAPSSRLRSLSLAPTAPLQAPERKEVPKRFMFLPVALGLVAGTTGFAVMLVATDVNEGDSGHKKGEGLVVVEPSKESVKIEPIQYEDVPEYSSTPGDFPFEEVQLGKAMYVAARKNGANAAVVWHCSDNKVEWISAHPEKKDLKLFARVDGVKCDPESQNIGGLADSKDFDLCVLEGGVWTVSQHKVLEETPSAYCSEDDEGGTKIDFPL